MEQIETGSFVDMQKHVGQADVLRVVSWNINRGQEFNAVVDFLSRTAADVVLLQETDVNARRTDYRHVPRDIAQALQLNYVFGYEFEELAQGGRTSPAYHGQTTLSRFPLLGPHTLRFRNQSDFWRPRWFVPKWQPLQRRLGGRMALVSSVEMRKRTLVLYNVHLESRGSDELRYAQLSELFDDVHQHHSGTPVLVAGDFNLDLSQPPAANLVSHMGFANILNHGSRRPTTTSSRVRAARTIDWVLSRGPVAPTQVSLHDSICGSDHYPLSLTLRWA